MLTIEGLTQPNLAGWDASFYIDPSQTTLDAVDKLKEGLPYQKVREFLIAEGWQSPVANPMYTARDNPGIPLDFVTAFANFQVCQMSGDILQTCDFVFYTLGERQLTVATNITKIGSIYEPLIRSWNLE